MQRQTAKSRRSPVAVGHHGRRGVPRARRDGRRLSPTRQTYATGQNPLLSIKLTNNGTTDCTLNVGTSTQVFTITSGGDTWWRSTDCQTEPSDMVVLLGRRSDRHERRSAHVGSHALGGRHVLGHRPPACSGRRRDVPSGRRDRRHRVDGFGPASALLSPVPVARRRTSRVRRRGDIRTLRNRGVAWYQLPMRRLEAVPSSKISSPASDREPPESRPSRTSPQGERLEGAAVPVYRGA